MRPCASRSTAIPNSSGAARTPAGDTNAATAPEASYSTAERSAKTSRAETSDTAAQSTSPSNA